MPIGDGAGTITKGQRKISDVAAARRVLQIDKALVNVSNDVAPLVAVLRKLGKEEVVNQTSYSWYETDHLHWSVTDSGAGATSGATTLNLTAGHGNRVVANTILKVLRTGELIRVSAVAADALTVVRGFGGTTAAAINASEEIMISNFADLEGSGAPTSQISEPTIKTNVCQTFRQAIELSGRELEAEVYGGPEWDRALTDATNKMNHMIERAILTNNGQNTGDPSMTGGAEFFVTTNVTNVGGNLTEQVLIDSFLTPWFRRNYSHKSMVVFAGEKFRRALDIFGRDMIRYAPTDTGIGISVAKYRCAFGEIEVMPHAALTPLGSTVTAANFGLQGYAFGLQLDMCGLKVFGKRRLKLRTGNPDTGIAAPDTDGKKVELLADLGFYLKSEQQHAIMKGITG